MTFILSLFLKVQADLTENLETFFR